MDYKISSAVEAFEQLKQEKVQELRHAIDDVNSAIGHLRGQQYKARQAKELVTSLADAIAILTGEAPKYPETAKDDVFTVVAFNASEEEVKEAIDEILKSNKKAYATLKGGTIL